MFKKGFTLIELLIVVSIIGILAVALIPSLTDAPARARDAGRKAMVNELVAAVESYNIDEGNYPGADFCVDNATVDCSDTTYDDDKERFVCEYLGGSAPDANGIAAEGECDDATNQYARYEQSGGGYTVFIETETPGNATELGAADGAAPRDATTEQYYEADRSS